MRRLFLFLLFPFVCFGALEEWGIKKAIYLATMFDEALIDLSQSSSNISGLPKEERLKININLLPFTIPPIFPNASFKVKVLEEKRKLPQIAVEIDYGEIITLRFAEKIEDIEHARCWTAGASLILQKGLIFGGIRKIKGECSVALKGGTSTELIRPEELPTNVSLDEIAIFSGLYIAREKHGNWCVTGGYIPAKKKLFSKIECGFRKHWSFSLGIYPEGVFTFHPMVNLRW